MINKLKFSATVKDWRTEKGWSLREASEKLGIHAQLLHKIENNQRKVTAEELLKFASVFNKSLDDLVVMNTQNEPVNTMNLQRSLRKVGKEYIKSTSEHFKDHEIATFIRSNLPETLYSTSNVDTEKYKITGSPGKGRWATIPWVSIFNVDITTSATSGFYIVYLYRADMSGVYISFNQGWTYYMQKYGTKIGREKALTVASSVLSYLDHIPEQFDTKPIDLASEANLAKGYEATHILGRYYDFNDLPTNDVFEQDLQDMLEFYEGIASAIGKKTVTQFNDELLLSDDGVYLETEEEAYQDQANNVNEDNIDKTEPAKSPQPRKEPVITLNQDKQWPRDGKLARAILKGNDYQCSVDPSHTSFIVKTGTHQFMEAHHLVPMAVQEEFEYTLDCKENLISLCPNCHRKIHHGTVDEVADLLRSFLTERRDQLEWAKIEVTQTQLKRYYGIQ